MSGGDLGGNTERTSTSQNRLFRGLHPLLLVGVYVALGLVPLVLAAIQGRLYRAELDALERDLNLTVHLG